MPERLKQSYPPYTNEGEAAAAAGQTFRHRKTLLYTIIVQAGIKGAVTMTGYVWSVTAVHIRVGICVFSIGKATYWFLPCFSASKFVHDPKILHHIDPAIRIVPVPT